MTLNPPLARLRLRLILALCLALALVLAAAPTISAQDDELEDTHDTTDPSAEGPGPVADLPSGRASVLDTFSTLSEPDGIVVEDGVTQPVFNYGDAIREAVRVPGAVSSEDGDEIDMIHVDIIRPAASDGALQVPTIIVPSPYYHSNGRGRSGGSNERHKRVPEALIVGDEAIEARLMSRANRHANETGILADCGLAQFPSDCPPEVEGNIALIERGTFTFVQKVNSAADAGAIGVVMYNNVGGHLANTISSPIPTFGIPRADGLALLDLMAEGDVEVTMGNQATGVFPLYYDNYFVPRGYAVALLDLAGTRGSTGCLDIGGPAEIDNSAKVVEWLNGQHTAYDMDGNEVAADWSNGLSAMVGKSWDGTVANGVAALGVEGLATIVPITSISSWHNYYWANGVGYAGSPLGLRNNIQGNNPGRPTSFCTGVTAELAAGQGNPDPTTDFWMARNYLPNVENMTASVFVVHGLNDYNVKPHNYGMLWDELERHDVPRKIWLSQVAHEKAFDFRREEWLVTINRWFDYWLHGVENGIMDEPMADVEYAPDQWATYDTWPGGTMTTLLPGQPEGEDDPRPGTLSLNRRNLNPASQTFRETRQSRNAAAQNGFAERADRLVFMTGELTEPVRLSGTPYVSLRATIEDSSSAVLSAYLVDYGTTTRTLDTTGGGLLDLSTFTCYGQGDDIDTGCYADIVRRTTTQPFYVIARGWADANFITGESTFDPEESYRLEWDIFTDDYVFEAGHRIGIVITGSDTSVRDPYPFSSRGDITVHLNGSHVHLPIVGGPAALRAATR